MKIFFRNIFIDLKWKIRRRMQKSFSNCRDEVSGQNLLLLAMSAFNSYDLCKPDATDIQRRKFQADIVRLILNEIEHDLPKYIE